jgi:hypothetical protein
METNIDFSSRLFMSYFAADIPVVVQTNWYYQGSLGTLDSGTSALSGITEHEMLLPG